MTSDDSKRIDSYTLILTRGTHLVTREAGESVIAAIKSRETLVTLDVDMLCDGIFSTGVHIATQHVVAIVPNSASTDGDLKINEEMILPTNVSPIRSSRLGPIR